MARYIISPIADANCDSLNRFVIIATDEIATAQWHAEHNFCTFGAGILDTTTGKMDVGFGFGVPCLDFGTEG